MTSPFWPGTGIIKSLTAERVRELLAYDPETGLFIHRISRGRSRAGTVIGAKSNHDAGYCNLRVDGKLYFAHRLAWLHCYGEWPKHHIDHIDGDPMNNRIANLRDVSNAVNQQNIKRARSHNQMGFLGVYRQISGRFQARLTIDGRSHSLGGFGTPEEAHQAYLAGKRRLHEGCTI